MSKLKVSGNASGTGVITLEAPNTNTDRAITLPDSAGALVNTAPSTSGNILTSDGTNWTSAAPAAAGADTSLSNLTSTGEKRIAQAWVSFTLAVSTVSVSANYNVSSITDNAVGDFTVNFSTAMPNTNYCMTVSTGADDGVSYGFITRLYHTSGNASSAPTTTSARFACGEGTYFDPDYVSVIILGE